MSLDVYLHLENNISTEDGSGIFVRENGEIKEITRAEWDKKFPDREPIIVEETRGEVFWANITHNLNSMAIDAGIYEHLWRPDEINVTYAHQLIQPLSDGLVLLKSDPERFKRHNPLNGWGSYEGLIAFVEKYLSACKEYPQATIRVSR